MDQLAALKVFVRVAEAGSFSEAARRLNMSKSAVSKHVSSLEDWLGVKLLYRTTRRVSLTEAGQAYRERTQQILEDLEEADAAASQLSSEPKGTLKINAPLSFGLLYLSDLLAAFGARYPDILIDLELNDRVVDLIEEGYDVAIRIGELRDSSLIVRHLTDIEMVLAAAPAYLERVGTPTHPDALEHHDGLYYRSSHGLTEWRFSDGPGGQTLIGRPRTKLIANNGQVLCDAALSGLGLCYSPAFICADFLRNGSLVRLLEEYPTRHLTLSALYPPNRHLSAKVRAFIDFLVEAFHRTPPWTAGQG